MSALGEIRTLYRLIRRCIFTISSVVIQSHGVAFAPVSSPVTMTARLLLPNSANTREVKVGLELG